jgi:tRNA(Ile)-lysidine synthase
LYVAGLKAGVRFRPYGRPGSKKVGDFLTDRKFPRPLRDELPVVYDRRGVVWLAGVEIDHRMRVGPKTKETVKLEIRRY